MISLDSPLTWSEIAAIAHGASLSLTPSALYRLARAHGIVRGLVAQHIRGYGINTGVGALCDVIVSPAQQSALSRNIVMSHAVGIGAPLGAPETRAIMAAAINNYAHGYSGLRPELVEALVALLNAGCTPEVPGQGSVGYLSHMAHISLVLIGHGHAVMGGKRLTGAQALARVGLEPFTLEAKEGLSLVNGTVCATGLACMALAKAKRLLGWADAVAAMGFELQRCQISALAPAAMALRGSPGLLDVAARLNDYLEGSTLLAGAAGARTQDALSLRAVPQAHGAVRDVFANVAELVDRELRSVTDNPIVTGTPDAPEVHSQAHAMGPAVGLAMDQLGTAMAQIGVMAERRLDRLVNPLVSGLPAFLAAGSGVESGFMIAQYAALSLLGENRRLAAPASLDAGITSGLQEDYLSHATPAALKALAILGNVQSIVAIELLAACQAYDLAGATPAPRLAPIRARVRKEVPVYADDRPLSEDFRAVTKLLEAHL